MDGVCVIYVCEEKYRVPVRKCEGQRQFSRPRHRWENNNQQDGGGMDWINLRMGTSSGGLV
jgi:hypothetical protein